MQDIIGVLSAIVVFIGLILACIGVYVERKEADRKKSVLDIYSNITTKIPDPEAEDYLVKRVPEGTFEQPPFEQTIDIPKLIIQSNRALTVNELRALRGVDQYFDKDENRWLPEPKVGWVKH